MTQNRDRDRPFVLYDIHLTTLEGAEIIPGKHSETRTRTKLLALANGHTAVTAQHTYRNKTHERTLVSVAEWTLPAPQPDIFTELR